MRDQREYREEARLAAQAEHDREISHMEPERLLLEERRRVAEAQRPTMSSATIIWIVARRRLHTEFRVARPDNTKTGRQFAERLCGYFDHWQELAKTPETYDVLRDKMVCEQFLRRYNEKLAIFLKERGCHILDTLATTAYQYLQAQGIVNLARGEEEKGKPMAAAKVDTASENKRKSLFSVQQAGSSSFRLLDEVSSA
ncbi:hypothetical protein HPB52_007888 [Rhipicephalus sanguineus]|uniref:SCAN box domain-containing protein n=1 Tax=Rhipicephalus sanguineus TaxID=34632 RepID=A0A9D4SWP8_RHISA|nr:hypothetical protein HPB52_007888 [Rhipicephalus sanguineus]